MQMHPPVPTLHLLVLRDLFLGKELDALGPAVLADDLPEERLGECCRLVDRAHELVRRGRAGAAGERRHEAQVWWQRAGGWGGWCGDVAVRSEEHWGGGRRWVKREQCGEVRLECGSRVGRCIARRQ